jgi:hypothetical protein
MTFCQPLGRKVLNIEKELSLLSSETSSADIAKLKKYFVVSIH